MKRILPVLFATLAFAQQSSATNVSGVITGTTTWTKANSPYIVTAHTLVDEGATLFIESGVEVRVDPNVDFFVDGSLRALGSATDPIIFKSNIANPNRKSWRGLNLRSDGVADSTVFNYCHFTSSETPVYAFSGDFVVIDHCLFTECSKAITAICYHGFYIGNSVVKHCDLGIGAGSDFGNSIVENNEVSHVQYGLSVTNGYVAGNFIHDVPETGIEFHGFAGKYSELTNNTVVNCGKGIVANGRSGNGVHHNLSAYNNFGYWVNDYGGNITNNTALHNKTGLYINSTIAVVKSNCIDSSTDYILQTDGWVQEIDVTGNYWGTADSATLYNNSHEFYDNFSSPKALILPALSQGDGTCKAYTGPVVTRIPETPKTAQLTVSPNPFTDRFAINLQGKATALEVFNMAGQKLISLDATNSNKMEVDMSAYPAGVYHYRVLFTDHTTATGKLIKQ